MTVDQAIARLAALQGQVDGGARLDAEDRAMVDGALAVVSAAVTTPAESAAMIARLRTAGAL